MEEHYITTPLGPKSREWLERWKRCSPQKPSLMVLTEGEGVHVKDVDGNVYIDLADQNVSVGHRNQRIIKAVQSQLEKSCVSTLRGSTPQKIELIEKIKEIVPNSLSNGKFEFCNTGSDASEFAMELTRSYTGKVILIAFLGGHYGHSIGTLSLTADRSENRRFCLPLIPCVEHIPYPYCYKCSFGQEYPGCNHRCLDYLKYIFDTVAHPDEIAGMFIEPIQQVAGVVIPPEDYLPKLRKICDDYKILLVDDEVATGFGRTGKMFGIEHSKVDPDLMLFGKRIANGISMAGIIARKEIMEKEAEFPMVKGGSFAGNPISCVSALATINEVQNRGLVENSARVGDHLIKRLREIQEQHEYIGDVRGKGLLLGIEFVKDLKSKEPSPELTEKVVLECFKRGLLVGRIGTYNQVIRLTPPLIISEEESDEAMEIFEESVKATSAHS
jgi:4-aminobutyrate aminotransferase-like enzyme